MTESTSPGGAEVATPELIAKLREAYRTASGKNPADKGLQAVFQHLRTAGLTTRPDDSLVGPWDVFISRRTGERLEPVRLAVEANAVLNLVFPDHDLGGVEFVDRTSGHLLVQRLPWEDTIELYESHEVLHELPTVGYLVLVPPIPPGLVDPPDISEAAA